MMASSENGSENVLPHDKAGEENFPLKQFNKITKWVPNVQKIPIREMHRWKVNMNPPGFK